MRNRRPLWAGLCIAAMVSVCSAQSAQAPRREPNVACANLVYAGTKSSVCFSDKFLKRIAAETRIRPVEKLARVRLDDASALAQTPFAIMTGEGRFTLTERERTNLRRFIKSGGFLVASAGCSNAEWARSFRSEFARVFPKSKLRTMPLTHPLFKMVYLIRTLETVERQKLSPAVIEGAEFGGRVAVVFSQDGLNDTSNAENCCCCGGDEIKNAEFVNVNLLAYALLH